MQLMKYSTRIVRNSTQKQNSGKAHLCMMLHLVIFSFKISLSRHPVVTFSSSLRFIQLEIHVNVCPALYRSSLNFLG